MAVRLNEDMSKRKQTMRQVRERTWRWSLLLVVAVTLAACGSDEENGSGATPDFAAALKGAPPKLAALHEQGNELLPGGTEAFDARLRKLRGYPVVVNKWASWCGPCRSEFAYFQSQAAEHGKKVAFLGVDSNDGEDSARDFLADFPVPYPSYLDPDQEIADQLEGALAFPATAFYDRDDELAADIERYAGSG